MERNIKGGFIMINFNEQHYKIIESKNNARPFAVFVRCDGFWAQCSRWYFYKGNAVRKLKQLNGAYFNTPKVLAQFNTIKKGE